MSSGMIYVEVSASAANSGINLLSSGIDTGGETEGTYWLYWTSEGGFTNRGWHYDEANNYLSTGWPNVAQKHGQEPTKAGFLKYMETGPDNLDDILGAWPPEQKADFAMEFGNGFVTNGGCVELV